MTKKEFKRNLEKDYQYPTKEEIYKSLDTFWENNDIQMIFWKKYFKEK